MISLATRSWGWKGAKRTNFGSLSRDEALARRDSVKAELDAFLEQEQCRSCSAVAGGASTRTQPHMRNSRRVPAASISSTCSLRRAISFATMRRCVQNCRSASLISSSTSFRIRTPSRPRSSCFCRPTIPMRPIGLMSSPIPGKLFLVGDPKQSIYRFRRADIAIYQQVKQMLLSRGAAAPAPQHELPQPALVAVLRQRRLCAGHGRNAADGRVCAARELADRNQRKADYRRIACPAALWRLGQDRQLPNRRVSTRCDWCVR